MYNLATVERLSKEYESAKCDYEEALKIAEQKNDRRALALTKLGLARLSLDLEEWSNALRLARDAVSLSEAARRQEFVARGRLTIAKALVHLGRPAEAWDEAKYAVDIFDKLGSRHLEEARAVLKECEGSG